MAQKIPATVITGFSALARPASFGICSKIRKGAASR